MRIDLGRFSPIRIDQVKKKSIHRSKSIFGINQDRSESIGSILIGQNRLSIWIDPGSIWIGQVYGSIRIDFGSIQIDPNRSKSIQIVWRNIDSILADEKNRFGSGSNFVGDCGGVPWVIR